MLLPRMPQQFSAKDIVRLLLNVETSVVREALTDPRLADAEIWLKKNEILDAIRAITPDFEQKNVIAEIIELLIPVLEAALRANKAAREVWEDQGGIINRLLAAINRPFEVILEAMLAALEGFIDPPEPFPLEEFDLSLDGGGTAPPSVNLQPLRTALVQLLTVQREVATARTKVLELFLEIDPVFSLAQGPILGNLNNADQARASAQRLISEVI